MLEETAAPFESRCGRNGDDESDRSGGRIRLRPCTSTSEQTSASDRTAGPRLGALVAATPNHHVLLNAVWGFCVGQRAVAFVIATAAPSGLLRVQWASRVSLFQRVCIDQD